MPTVRALRHTLSAPLIAEYGEQEAHAILWLLIEHASGLEYRLLRMEQNCITLSPQQTAWLEAAIARVCAHEPVQYVTGKAHFYGREFAVSPAVLVPRQETELLALQTAQALAIAAKHTARPRLLDVGTGSGCIPITAQLEARALGAAAEVWAIDISADALAVAEKNAANLGATITFLQADVLDSELILPCFPVDVLVSNPPYIPAAERQTMPRNVVEHEPHLALFVPDSDPLVFYWALARLAVRQLVPGGVLLCEIHENLGPETVALFQAEGLTEVMLRPDLQGKSRIVAAKNKKPTS